MIETVRTVTYCRVCGATDWSEVFSFGSMPLANSYPPPESDLSEEPQFPLEVIRCNRCFLICLRHVVHPDVLFRDYIYLSSDTNLINSHMHWVRDTCLNEIGTSTDGLVVELGSNTGTQLQLFREAGMRVLGIDPAKNIKPVAEIKGVPTIADFFNSKVAEKIVSDSEQARLIIGRHVFAHIDDLSDVIAGVRNLLHPSGIFVIEVPHIIDLIAKNQFDTIYHEHLSYFSVHTLRYIFASNGLRIFDIHHRDVHGGSLIVMVSFDSSEHESRPSVSSILELEKRFGLTEESTYQGFADRAQETIDTVRGVLQRLASEGKEVVGYGAPAKGNTLLNACQLTPNEIAYCTDTTPAKQGLLLPGTRIPIHPPERAKEKPPDYFLLLAWNYAKEVVRNELPYVAAGGQFIVPIPTVTTLSSEKLVERFFATEDAGSSHYETSLR